MRVPKLELGNEGWQPDESGRKPMVWRGERGEGLEKQAGRLNEAIESLDETIER